jgi:hypothetical protein
MSLHVAIDDQREQEQRQWHMSAVQEEDPNLNAQSQLGDMRTQQPTFSTLACGKVSTWTQGRAVLHEKTMASMRFASVHMASTSTGADGVWYRGCRSMEHGMFRGGLVVRGCWSRLGASRIFGWARRATYGMR